MDNKAKKAEEYLMMVGERPPDEGKRSPFEQFEFPFVKDCEKRPDCEGTKVSG